MDEREIATKVAWSLYGKPYLWGGDDPIDGYDCSGFCIEILKSTGVLPRDGDWTAQSLWDGLKRGEVCKPGNGCLVFWTNSKGDKVVHVEFAINNELCIGASGGGSRTLNKEDAAEQNAYVKVRPWKTRKNVKGFIDPFSLSNWGGVK